MPEPSNEIILPLISQTEARWRHAPIYRNEPSVSINNELHQVHESFEWKPHLKQASVRENALFVMREVMWNHVGIRLAAGKCSLGRRVLRAIRALSRLFTWESDSRLRRRCREIVFWAGGRTAGEQQLISHQWETLHNEPRSFQAKPQENTRIYSSERLRGKPEVDSFIDSSSVSDFTKWLLNASVNDSLSFSKKEQKTTTFWEVVDG